MADPADLTALQLLAAYADRSLSPVEATQAVLRRIERLQPVLNAFCLVDPEAALQQARESEQRWLSGQATGTLDGVPVSIKDLILTQGWPTLRGSLAVDPHQDWSVDAPATARLREAGAVLIGKTTTPEFGCKAETNSLLTGLTRNPWNPERTPGGSSGGAAAAVTAGMGPLAVGTDGAGSIRIPAAFCGSVGLKPSFGRVPAYPSSPFGTVAHLGPHARTVADAALMLDVLARPDARDWFALPAPEQSYLAACGASVKGIRVAWSPTLGYASHVDPDVAAATASAVGQLEQLGLQVEQIDPGFEDPLDISTGLWFLGAYTVWSSLDARQRAVLDPDFAAQAELGSRLTTLQVQQLHQRRAVLGSHMRQFMTRFDVLVTPSVAIPAFESRPAGWRPMDAEAMLGWTPFSYPFNLTQQPAITIPCGLSRDGLPIGLQVVGPMHGDALVIAVAHAIEGMLPKWRPALDI